MCDHVDRWKALSSELKQFPKTFLLVVSKNAPSEAIAALFQNGQVHFGENRVQELLEKADSLSRDIKWHFIGHLQSNKCSLLLRVPNLHMVESLDSTDIALKVADALGREGNRTLFVLVQVNTSLKPSQFGLDYRDVDSIFEVVQTVIDSQVLLFRGLMTIGDGSPDCFDRLVDLKSKLSQRFPQCRTLSDTDQFVLSMGMSNDYQLAISRGSTQVRIGSLIFK